MGKSKPLQFESSDNAGETCPEIARGSEVLYVTRSEIENMGYTETDIIELTRIALTEHGNKRVEMPAKIGIHPISDTFHHAMPAFIPTVRASGMKWVACFPDNHRYKLNQTSALIILNDVQTGWPIALMDGTWITAKRTAAVSAIAVEALANRDTCEIGIIGCGVQGQEHLMALATVLPGLERVKVLDIRPGAAKQMIDKFGNSYSFEITEASSVAALVHDSGVVVSATAILKTPKPLVKDEWIEPGVLLLPVDFDSVFEWKTMKRADKFLVDSIDEMNYFMSIGYLAHGLPPLHGEIGEVVAGLKHGRQNDKEVIFDMNIGMGVVDLVVAKGILDKAIKENIGTKLPL